MHPNPSGSLIQLVIGIGMACMGLLALTRLRLPPDKRQIRYGRRGDGGIMGTHGIVIMGLYLLGVGLVNVLSGLGLFDLGPGWTLTIIAVTALVALLKIVISRAKSRNAPNQSTDPTA